MASINRIPFRHNADSATTKYDSFRLMFDTNGLTKAGERIAEAVPDDFDGLVGGDVTLRHRHGEGVTTVEVRFNRADVDDPDSFEVDHPDLN